MVFYLQHVGYPMAERRALSGALDRGDISGVPRTMIEVKSCKTWQLSAWMKEVEVERRNADADIGLLVVRRKGFINPGDWYAIMPFAEALNLIGPPS
ncbi:MAG: hypothetical protein E4H44_00335 [Candidatus Aminicenantes bacterium]|nr:MAG: hypothetical protein E4H44_00335 [Candidatus Aminicenantes bacterium]